MHAPKMYKVYSIPKRSFGHRIIAQPTPQLKSYQRVLIELLEGKLPIHPNAYSYRKGIGIKENAIIHSGNDYLLKMDFQNFFNKIKPNLFLKVLFKNEIKITDAERQLFENIFFWKPGKKRSITKILSVGAPSSPFITNVVMFDFDSDISLWCQERGVSYTRYADDITFSTKTKGQLFEVPKIVEKKLRKHAPGLTINESKTVFSSKAHNRHVTGICINNDNAISLGRERKREISSLIHKFKIKALSDIEVNYLKGLMSFAKHIEPSFLLRMENKYGCDVISLINKWRGVDE